MEPFKALTFLAAVGIVSFVSAGAAGFYAGYSAGRSNLDEIKAQIAGMPGGTAASALAMRPVQDDLRTLSRQVEALASVKPAVADPGQTTKPVLDEIKALGRQVEGWKARQSAEPDPNSNRPVLEEIRTLSRQVDALKTRAGADPDHNLKPLLDEVKALSRAVETSKPRQGAEPDQGSKLVLEEIKALARQVEASRGRAPVAAAAAEPDRNLKPVLDEIKSLSRQVETLKTGRPAGEPGAGDGKPVLDEIRALSRQVEAFRGVQPNRGAEGLSGTVVPDYTEALHSIREQVAALNTKLEKQEPKAPKALLDEFRSLSASIQGQEGVARRAVAEELRSAVAALQNSEARIPKVLTDEIRTISANTRPDARPQTSAADQIKVLAASIESLKARLAEDGGRGRGDSGAGVAGEVAQIRQLVATASDQFRGCQTQLASLSGGAGFAHAQQQGTATPAALPQAGHQPSTVVFYDNVMLKKDQEKQYDEIGVRLALQQVGPRQVKVAVNRQGVGLAFGERKVFRSQDVECELNLMETNLNEGQARVSISCKR
jgi:hypothetical protein